MIRQRIIPVLLMQENMLVKTTNFRNAQYIGDPINTVRIFNELEVDELIILDIGVNYNKVTISFQNLKDIASECFIPLSYGGGISSINQAEKIFKLGFEKIIINTFAFKKKMFLEDLIKNFGGQSIVHSIDIKKTFFNPQSIFIESGSKRVKLKLCDWLKYIQDIGIGEILITNIDNEGTWQGFDFELVKKVSNLMSIPVIANGGCGSYSDIKKIFDYSNGDAAAVGSMFVFQKKGMGVLINYPTENDLKKIF